MRGSLVECLGSSIRRPGLPGPVICERSQLVRNWGYPAWQGIGNSGKDEEIYFGALAWRITQETACFLRVC